MWFILPALGVGAHEYIGYTVVFDEKGGVFQHHLSGKHLEEPSTKFLDRLRYLYQPQVI